MEKNNNGKLAIAIVAMFVVALSIVGVTYAYFTSQTVYNESEEVIVETGVLKVNYTAGDSINTLDPNGDGDESDKVMIVPGWANDGKMVYHPVASNDNGKVSAVDYNTLGDEADTYKANAIAPLEFTVTNNSSTNAENDTIREAYYGIRLRDVSNGMTDSDKVKIFLYTNESMTTLAAGWTLEGRKLGTDSITKISGPIAIQGDPHSYYLVVKYENDPDNPQDQGKSLSVTVEVVGLNKLSDGSFVAADGSAWTALETQQ